MSGTDQIVINTRERASSGDVNDLQSLKDRTYLDSFRSMLVSQQFGFGATPTEASRNVCLGGYVVTPSGADVVISPGTLLQESAVLPPTPGALDSTYRLALLKSSATETPPVPGVETFYVLEAQMVEVVALSTIVDIFDPGTGLFVPTLEDKRTERVPSFRFVVGTPPNAPAPTFGDWVPIAIVRRPGGGGPVVATDIIDIRPLWDAGEVQERVEFKSDLAARGDRRIATVAVPGGVDSNEVFVFAEAFNPERLWHVRDSSLDVTAATVIDPTVTLAALTWYYLYLVPWQGLAPVDPRDANGTGQGVLVLTDQPPAAQGGSRNGTVFNMPAPFNVATVPIDDAVCVAALFRNVGNTGWFWSESLGRDQFVAVEDVVLSTAPVDGVWTAVDISSDIPDTARAARVQIRAAGLASGGAGFAELAVAPAAGATADYFFVKPGMTPFLITTGPAFGFDAGSVVLDVPVVASTTFFVQIVGIGITLSSISLDITRIGWSE